MSSREIDAFLEERLDDINELIQSELGFPSLNITEPFTAPEIHNLSFLLETEGTSIGLLSDNILPGEYTTCVLYLLLILWSNAGRLSYVVDCHFTQFAFPYSLLGYKERML